MTSSYATATERLAPTSVRRADGTEVKLTTAQSRLVELLLDEPETVSPQDAAFLLGVSRPMVVRWIREGLLEDRKTGSHHRIPLTSVHALQEQRAEAGRAAVESLREAKADSSAARRTAPARNRAQARIARRDHTS